jgi:PAS domain-containing protein
MNEIDLNKFSARLEALVRDAEALGVAPDLKAALTAALDILHRSEESGSAAKASPGWNEDKYRLLVENSLNSIAVVQDGKIVFGNSRVGAIAGYDAEKIKSFSFLEIVHPDDRHIILEQMRRDAAGEKRPIPSKCVY